MAGGASIRSEDGAATIVENTIVLPIVLVVVLALLYVGYTLHERAVLEAATARAAVYAVKTIQDPHYEDITVRDPHRDVNEIVDVSVGDGAIAPEPYRYLFGRDGDLPESETMMRTLIMQNQLFTSREPSVSVRRAGGVFTKVVATAEQTFELPVFPLLDLPPLLVIKSTSTVYVNEPAEFIRNVDYAIDIVQDIGQATGITDMLNTTVSKIDFFKSQTS